MVNVDSPHKRTQRRISRYDPYNAQPRNISILGVRPCAPQERRLEPEVRDGRAHPAAQGRRGHVGGCGSAHPGVHSIVMFGVGTRCCVRVGVAVDLIGRSSEVLRHSGMWG
jgi:hypothetical protein